MQVIHKFKMTGQYTTFEMPAGAVILDTKLQQNDLVIWAMCDPDKQKRERHFGSLTTGNRFDLKIRRYLGTVIREYDNYVLHVFELNVPGP